MMCSMMNSQPHSSTCPFHNNFHILHLLVTVAAAVAVPAEWRSGADRFHHIDINNNSLHADEGWEARDVTAGRSSAQRTLERLDLFRSALNESSAGRAATNRAAVWARSSMCIPATSARVLMYNRVPKTGSTAVKTAVNALRRTGMRMFSLTNEQSAMRESAE